MCEAAACVGEWYACESKRGVCARARAACVCVACVCEGWHLWG